MDAYRARMVCRHDDRETSLAYIHANQQSLCAVLRINSYCVLFCTHILSVSPILHMST